MHIFVSVICLLGVSLHLNIFHFPLTRLLHKFIISFTGGVFSPLNDNTLGRSNSGLSPLAMNSYPSFTEQRNSAGPMQIDHNRINSQVRFSYVSKGRIFADSLLVRLHIVAVYFLPLTLLHSEHPIALRWPKLHRVLAILSAVGLSYS